MTETLILPKNTKMLSIITFGVIAGASLATFIAIREWMAAKKAAKNKKLAEAELTAAAIEKGIDPTVAAAIPASEFSGCCGGTSNASGKIVDYRYQPDFTSEVGGRFTQVNRPTQPTFQWRKDGERGYEPIPVFKETGDYCNEGGVDGRWQGTGGHSGYCRVSSSS